MKVFYVPLNVDGAGCYRCIFPMAYLGDRGHTTGLPAFTLHHPDGRPVPPLPAPGLLGKIPPGFWTIQFQQESVPDDFDVYVFQLGSWQWQLEWAEQIRARNPDARIVVDMDDDLHRVPTYNPARLDPASSPLNNRRNAQKLLELSDAASFATVELANFYSRWQPNATVIPNYLHWPMWEQLPPVYEHRAWSKLRVGYMGNAAFHAADLETIAPTLRKWLVAHPDVEFVAAGDPRIHDIVGTPAAQQVSTSSAWFRNLDLPYMTSTFDIGLVPLVRNEFNEGKSCLKGMEYAACGIPSIASPTAEYRRWVDDGVTGMLARHPSDFAAALDRLYADRGLLARMGGAARAKAEQHTIGNHIGEWEDFYGRICDGHHTDASRAGVAA